MYVLREYTKKNEIIFSYKKGSNKRSVIGEGRVYSIYSFCFILYCIYSFILVHSISYQFLFFHVS